MCTYVLKRIESDGNHRKRGDCDLYELFRPGERYEYDCGLGEGWEQYDTSQDAPYFGVWVNKKTFMTLTYAEGDVTLCKCHTAEVFNNEIREMNECYSHGFIAKTFDESGVTVYQQDRDKFFIKETV